MTSILSLEDQTQRTVEDMEETYGKSHLWNKENGERCYYQYTFSDNIELRLFSDDDGALIFDDFMIKYVHVVNLTGNNIMSDETEFLPKEKRIAAEWSKLNEYAYYIGKTYNEIKDDFPDIVYSPDQYAYIDEDSGVNFAIRNNNCRDMGIPAVLLFESIKSNSITREQLREYWGISHKWEIQYYPFYTFAFDDVIIYIYTDKQGTFSKDDLVLLQDASSLSTL